MDTKQVRITSLTSLITARDNYYNHPGQPVFTLTFDSVGSINPDISYCVYRYIGDYPADTTIDPPMDIPYLFKKIATLSPTATNYDDYLTDLDVNGFHLNNGYWVDSNGYNILDQILTTKRAIYYKVVGVNTGSVSFNSTPFIFIGHENGSLECRSTITQVKFNTLYQEGDVIWNNLLYPTYAVKSIAVDNNYTDRQYTVWVAYTKATDSKIVRMDVRTGGIDLLDVYSIPYPIYSIRVDPSNEYGGDCIATGKKNKLVRCKVGLPGIYIEFGQTALSVGDNGGYAISLLKDNNDDVTADVVWDRHYVTNWGVSNPGSTMLYPVTSYGDYISTQYNPNGVTHGSNGDIFCNGRRKVRVSWSSAYTTPGSPGGTSTVCYMCYRPDGTNGHLTCYTASTPGTGGSTYYTTSYSNWFYADEGFIYQIGTNSMNRGAKFTSCINEAHYSTRTGSYSCFGNGHNAPDPNILGSTFWGIKTDIPVAGLGNDNYNIWQVLDLEQTVVKTAWTGTTPGHPGTYGSSTTYLIGSGVDAGEVVVDSENCVWAIARLGANHAKIYQLANNATFPTGINCVWPVSGDPAWTYDSYFLNDPYVEYVLTRDPTVWGVGAKLAAYNAIVASTIDSEKRALARVTTLDPLLPLVPALPA